jgi:hypothetical protein
MTPLSTRMFDIRARALSAQLRSHPGLHTALPDDGEFVGRRSAAITCTGGSAATGTYRAGRNSRPPSVFDIAAVDREGIRWEALRVSRLNMVFHMFVLPGEPVYFAAVRAEVEKLGPDYSVMNLPVPISSDVAQLLLLPKDDHKAARVAGVFRRDGAIDFGAYLDQVIRRDLIALGESHLGGSSRDAAADETERPRG